MHTQTHFTLPAPSPPRPEHVPRRQGTPRDAPGRSGELLTANHAHTITPTGAPRKAPKPLTSHRPPRSTSPVRLQSPPRRSARSRGRGHPHWEIHWKGKQGKQGTAIQPHHQPTTSYCPSAAPHPAVARPPPSALPAERASEPRRHAAAHQALRPYAPSGLGREQRADAAIRLLLERAGDRAQLHERSELQVRLVPASTHVSQPSFFFFLPLVELDASAVWPRTSCPSS